METLAIRNLSGYISDDETSAEFLQQLQCLEEILSHHAQTRSAPIKDLHLVYYSSSTFPSAFERKVMAARWKDASWVEDVRWEDGDNGVMNRIQGHGSSQSNIL
jgi:hypothetical protein